MKEEKIAVHERAINLARRYSVQNENDLMQEDFMDAPIKKQMTHDDCIELSHHLLHPTALPSECKKFQDVVSFLKRRDSDTTHPTQFLS
ncbi:hypothetical protein IV203_029805 [Nitzschia inconspicua]|uniref:Uncharacterized protein n=1 Tax=Nitzschia inconspicua TaxID=303405 RepID=A0A9K3Q1J7_9STRA|nr:hypothetical protein IV203_029805 [Nitzschia inconspicua]